ncbi:hypothetical protein B0H10DRAFT_2218156 [Mycena sp. CBHHK59/15]|nr:hypothetical protein B0H10DRAFT_2218156 [Mycena sp. CBHHK59/15]
MRFMTLPSTTVVPVTFCKDMGTYAFYVTEWNGSIINLAKRIGVTAGACIRGAYAIAIAEGEESEDALVFEVADGSRAAGFSPPPWGFCSHVKPTRIHVQLRRQEQISDDTAHFTQIIRDANRSHSATLPYLGSSWQMSQKMLGRKDVNFATSIVNILDLSRGDFRKDMKHRDASGSSDSLLSTAEESVRQIFANTLVFESVVGIYVPVYVEVHILKEKVTYACPYDPSIVKREDMEKFVLRRIEVLETLANT